MSLLAFFIIALFLVAIVHVAMLRNAMEELVIRVARHELELSHYDSEIAELNLRVAKMENRAG